MACVTCVTELVLCCMSLPFVQLLQFCHHYLPNCEGSHISPTASKPLLLLPSHNARAVRAPPILSSPQQCAHQHQHHQHTQQCQLQHQAAQHRSRSSTTPTPHHKLNNSNRSRTISNRNSSRMMLVMDSSNSNSSSRMQSSSATYACTT